MLAVAVTGAAGGVAWSSSDRRVPIGFAPAAGEFADRLDCGGSDPLVRNDLGLWDDASAPSTGHPLPVPPWLRDRSLSATRIRTAADAARWSNTNTEAAAAFGTVTLAEWDADTGVRLERAADWMRAWWSRNRRELPRAWTEGTALAAVRDAVLDDRRLTEQVASTVRGSLRWRVLPLAAARQRADTAVIGGTRQDDSRLLEVLVYRRSADGYLRLRGRAYCGEVEDAPSGGATRDGDHRDRLEAPALACTRTLSPPARDVAVAARAPVDPPAPARVVDDVVDHVDPPAPVRVVGSPAEAVGSPVEVVDGNVTAPAPHAYGDAPGVRRPPSLPDGHTLPRELPRDDPGPALGPEVALERVKTVERRSHDTVEGRLSYALVGANSTRAYAAGTHNGQVKRVIELRRELGGGWSVTNHSGCYADLVAPVEGPRSPG